MTAVIVVLSAAVVLLGVLVIGLLRSQAQVLRLLEEITRPGAGEGAADDGAADDGVADDAGRPEPGAPGRLPSRSRRPARSAPSRPSRVGSDGTDIRGESPEGNRLRLGVAEVPRVLLVFLTSSCRSCRPLWDALSAGQAATLPSRPVVAVVTPSPTTEDRSRVADLAGDAPVVMSSDGWHDYAITGSSFVVVVDRGTISAEGPVGSWDELEGLVRREPAS